MRLFDFSLLKMLDYPFQPSKWFRNNSPYYPTPLINKDFTKILKTMERSFKQNQYYHLPFKKGECFTQEQCVQVKEMFNRLSQENGKDYSKYIQDNILPRVMREGINC